MGGLVGMAGSQSSRLQALPCAEGAATGWARSQGGWLWNPGWWAGLVLACWWTELGSEVGSCRARVPRSSVILLVVGAGS